MDNLYTITEILKEIENASYKREHLNFLIEKSFQISLSTLKSKFYEKLNLRPGDLTLEDIAMNAIVPLFVKNSKGKLGIIPSLKSWKDEINNEDDAIYFLSNIIWKRVNQEVTKQYKQNDPVFDKILKTLQFCIKTNSLTKCRYFGTVYILPKGEKEINGPVIDKNEFNKIPLNLFANKQMDLFNILFNYLLNNFDYQIAIPLNLLVTRIKLYHSSNNFNEFNFTESSESKIISKDLIEHALNEVKSKLDSYYIANDKLNKSEADLIYASFTDISKDMLTGGAYNGLYSYMQNKNKSLTSEEFYNKYHHIMKYLMIGFKENISKNIFI